MPLRSRVRWAVPWVLCLGWMLAGARSPAEDAPPKPPAEEARPSGTPTNLPPREVKPPPEFRPSEEVPADMGIDFPVDI